MGRKSDIKKTNAMRELDTARIGYRTVMYEVDETDLSGLHLAHELGADPSQIFKTLVLEDDHKENLVCCIPVDCELDLKKVAAVAGVKRAEMIAMKTLFDVTGYIRGGCSPLAMKRRFPTFIDETAILFEEIAVSGGMRGIQIIVNPEQLAGVVDASFADLTR